ncbi:MAG: type II secretion system protein [Phycisphaeraceae bacterium]|nr:type II secretion system protein [Phycisphaeraceae bacterium]
MHSVLPMRRAFTLVEILIVVVILGILAAIVIPQFTSATQEAQANATYNELQKLRRTVGVFRARNNDSMPAVSDGNGTWGEIVGDATEYLQSAPVNAWVGGANAREVRVVPDATPDAAFQTMYGWIFDPNTGQVWAGGFDVNDKPLPRS